MGAAGGFRLPRWDPELRADAAWIGRSGTRWESNLFRDVTLGSVEYVAFRLPRGLGSLLQSCGCSWNASQMHPVVASAPRRSRSVDEGRNLKIQSSDRK